MLASITILQGMCVGILGVSKYDVVALYSSTYYNILLTDPRVVFRY
jgi:hypothetical protein